MKHIPSKFSHQWGWLFTVYFIIIYAFLIFSRMLLHSQLTFKLFIGVAVVAVVSALIACIGGFWGGKKFFIVYTVSVLIGLLYMMYIIVFNISPGWDDLTSMISYLFFIVIGLGAGMIVEIAWRIYKAKLR